MTETRFVSIRGTEPFNAPKEYASTLSNSTFTIAQNVGRKGLIVSNPSDTVMTLRFSNTVPPAAATAAIGIVVPAGQAIYFTGQNGSVPDGGVSLFCAGSSKAYTIYEW